MQTYAGSNYIRVFGLLGQRSFQNTLVLTRHTLCAETALDLEDIAWQKGSSPKAPHGKVTIPLQTLPKAPQFPSTSLGDPLPMYGRGAAFSSDSGQGLASQPLGSKEYFPSRPNPPFWRKHSQSLQPPAGGVAVIHNLHLRRDR